MELDAFEEGMALLSGVGILCEAGRIRRRDGFTFGRGDSVWSWTHSKRGWLYFRVWRFCVELDAPQPFGRVVAEGWWLEDRKLVDCVRRWTRRKLSREWLLRDGGGHASS